VSGIGTDGPDGRETMEKMTESKAKAALPDRLSNDPKSPYYNAELLERDVGVRFKGVEKTNVAEYCISEGWIKVEAGKTKDRYGNPLTIKLNGPVEVYFKDAK
jgi:Protein of unknown function (DUF3297)